MTIDNIIGLILVSMSVFIAIELFAIQEICKKLAKIKGKKSYSRQSVDSHIKNKLPYAERVGGSYYLTEKQIKWLATKIRTKKK